MRGAADFQRQSREAHHPLHSTNAAIQNAIEYYESISSEKYKIYKKRIQSFLSKPCVESMLKGKDGQLSLKKEMVERNRLHAIVNTKQEIVKIIEKSEKRADSNKKIVENLMRNQEQTLEARIERRKSMSNKSTKTDNDDFEEGEKVANEKMSVNLLIGGIKDRNVKRVFI